MFFRLTRPRLLLSHPKLHLHGEDTMGAPGSIACVFTGDPAMEPIAQPSLTRRCQIGDNWRNDVCPLSKRPQTPILVTPALQMDYRFSDSCIVLRRHAVSGKRSQAAQLKKIQRYGNSSSVPVGFLEICSKPSH